MKKRYLILVLLVVVSSMNVICAQDTTMVSTSDSIVKKPGFFKKIINYIAGDIEVDDEKAPTVLSVIGGPHYDSMAKFGIGIVANYSYRLKDCDSPLPPSNLSVKGDVSIAKFWSVEALNNMIATGDRYRMNTMLKMEFLPAYFWGMKFVNGNNDNNKVQMKQLRVAFSSDFLFRVANGFYMGPFVHWEYNHADSIELPELLEQQSLHQRNCGVGLTVYYDTRDFITGPTRGMYLHINQVFFPRFLWNGDYSFTRTDFRFSIYKKAWRGAIIAADLRTLFNFGSPSWATMALLGDSNNMRGYYHGRFRDNHMITCVVELRQRLWKWLGAVVWLGGGSVFHDGNSMNFLPNVGLGLRWAFRKHVNIRFDYGFGRAGESAFIFGINEAF